MSDPISIVKKYIKLLVKEYEFEEGVLLKLWTDKYPLEDAPMMGNQEKETVLDERSTLMLKKKFELQEMCRKKGCKVMGTKLVLVERILCKEPQMPTTVKKIHKKTNKTGKKKKVADILQKIAHDSELLNIRRNVFNNYEHNETKFVFDETTNCVVGKQNINGTIDALLEKDIETCKELNFQFKIPETIYTEKSHDDENV